MFLKKCVMLHTFTILTKRFQITSPKLSLSSSINSLINFENIEEKLKFLRKTYYSLPTATRDDEFIKEMGIYFRRSENQEFFIDFTRNNIKFLNSSKDFTYILYLFIQSLIETLKINKTLKKTHDKIFEILSANVNDIDLELFSYNFDDKKFCQLFLQKLRNQTNRAPENREDLFRITSKFFLKSKNREFCEELLKISLKMHKLKSIKRLLKKKGWNQNDFSFINESASNSLFYFHLKNSLSFWEMEEFYHNNEKMLYLLVKELYKKNKNMSFSIFQRNFMPKARSFNKKYQEVFRKNFENKHNTFEYLENPLIKFDEFKPMEMILETNSEKTPKNDEKNKFLTLMDYGITNERIKFISNREDLIFFSSEILNNLNKNEIMAIDMENLIENGSLSIIQIAFKDNVFIFDVLSLKDEERLWFMLKDLFEGNALKIGQNLAGDMRSLRKISQNFNLVPKNLIDLGNLFKIKFKDETKSSLAHIVEKLLAKKLSKQERMSNWGRRPLKKYQLHYAALDSYVMLEIFELLK